MFWIFVSKELKSVIRDPKMLIAMVVIPLIFVSILYFVLGQGITQQMQQAVRESGIVAVIDMDNSSYSRMFIDYLKALGLYVTLIDIPNVDDITSVVRGIDSKILYVIPGGFGRNISDFRPAKILSYVRIESLTIGEGGLIDTASKYIALFNSHLISILAREKGIPAEFISGAISGQIHGVLADRLIDNPGNFFFVLTMSSVFIPIVVLMLVVFAAQLVATSMAIEKEEKMFETLLSLPLSRMSIIGAKLLVSVLISSIYMITYSFALFGFLFGQIFGSIPGLSMDNDILSLPTTPSIVGIYMLVNVVGLALLMVSIALLLSLFAEDVRTAQAIIGNIIGPTIALVYLPMFIDVSSSFSARLAISLIPMANTVFIPKLAIIRDATSLAIASISNIVYGFVTFIVIRRIINSETVFTLKLRRKRREI